MYNLKKVIASICVIAMMLTTVAFGATYSDVAEDSAYYEAVETLNKLEIVTGYEDGTYKPEATVTRAEMAALIARIQGFGDSASAQVATSFSDVPASHWASGYVASAAGQKIINGHGDGTFGPDDPVLYEQAVKMIMATLGYTPYADNNGGYPGGYISAAQRYGVSNGVSNASQGTEANRGTIAQLLANAIDTPLMMQTGWNTNGEVEYVICDGKNNTEYRTLMSEYLGYVKVRGVVTANALTDLNAADIAINTEDAATVEIAVADVYDTTNKDLKNAEGTTVEFIVGTSDVSDYLGQSVICYVKDTNNGYEVVSVVLDTTRNDVLTMDLSQFNKVESASKLSYYKTSTAKTATQVTLAVDSETDDAVAVVYNNNGGQILDTVLGTYVAENGASLYGGQITLIDNDDVKGYDVIFVEVAATAVVDEVSDGYVALKTAAVLANDAMIDEIEIDEDDTESIVVIAKDGEEISYTDLKEWDVLSVIAADADSDYVLVEVISNSVVGAIASQYKSTSSEGGYGYKIGDGKYDVATGSYGTDNLAVGDGGTFYIDKYGKIAAFNEDAALASGVAANYAYVTKVAEDEDILTGELTFIVQMVTADGVVALNVKSTNAKLNIAGGSTKVIGTDTAYDSETELAAVLEGQVVKYTKNSSNLITAITLCGHDEKFETSVAGATDLVFDAENSKLGTKYVDADAMIFFIATDAEDSKVGTVADLEDETPYEVIKFYADNKAEDWNIIAVKGGEGTVSPTTSLAVITEVGVSSTEDGEEIYSMTVLVDGQEVTADTVATSELTGITSTDLTVGDIVKVRVGSDGVITAVKEVVNFTEGVRDTAAAFTSPAVAASGSTTEVWAGGQVTFYKKSSTQATIGGETYKLSQADNVYVIDATGRNIDIKRGSASSFKYFEALYGETGLATGTLEVTVDGVAITGVDAADEAVAYTDYVYVRQYDGKVKDVVIVKGTADLKIKAAN